MDSFLAHLGIWSLPIIGAFNGWITTYLGIRMLFRPRNPVRFFGLTYQAPLPKRQKEIAERIGAIVEAELLNYKDIQQRVVTPEFMAHVEQTVSVKIGEMLRERREMLPSLVQKLLPDEILFRAQRLLAREVADHLPELVDDMFQLLSEKVRIRHLIAEKVASFELQRLEDVIFSLTAKELRIIELLCGALGFLIGVLQMLFALL